MADGNVTVVGLQWGDEGKGKVVDCLAGRSRYVVRFCGGANAGHTVCVGDETFAFHLVPSGILHPHVTNVIGNGVAFDPDVAWQEISTLRGRGIDIGADNFAVSNAAHVVMPWHKLQDTLSEQALSADRKIGTTARGIGPCYSDKANRSTAIRAADLARPDVLDRRVREIVEVKNRVFSALYGAEPLNADEIIEQYGEFGRHFQPMLCNTGVLLRSAIAADEPILFEGGQGSMLDIDHGTYPFVTSSPVTACGVSPGTGVSPKQVGTVVGLVKAYTTRVGAGPFPSEQDNEIGDRIRKAGNEFGTTTGRPRRCGWFDGFLVRYTADLSGVDELAIALLDVLTGLEELRICTGYKVDGELIDRFDVDVLDRAECVYETLPGWTEDITECRSFADLPANAQAYVRRIEQIVGRPAGFISVGPKRSALILNETSISGL